MDYDKLPDDCWVHILSYLPTQLLYCLARQRSDWWLFALARAANKMADRLSLSYKWGGPMPRSDEDICYISRAVFYRRHDEEIYRPDYMEACVYSEPWGEDERCVATCRILKDGVYRKESEISTIDRRENWRTVCDKVKVPKYAVRSLADWYQIFTADSADFELGLQLTEREICWRGDPEADYNIDEARFCCPDKLALVAPHAGKLLEMPTDWKGFAMPFTRYSYQSMPQ